MIIDFTGELNRSLSLLCLVYKKKKSAAARFAFSVQCQPLSGSIALSYEIITGFSRALTVDRAADCQSASEKRVLISR